MSTAADRPRWYLVQSRPRQAERAEFNLRNQGYTVYHPRLSVERVRRGRRLCCEESLFPNYLFIRLQRWVDNWHPLRSTRGVARLVGFGNEPQPVDDALIDDIRCRLSERPAEPALKPGQPVRIVEGPFRGLDAIFQTYDGEQRVCLLIELLHRQARLTLPLTGIRKYA
jgi:transcriptional antiterminator RfaH